MQASEEGLAVLVKLVVTVMMGNKDKQALRGIITDELKPAVLLVAAELVVMEVMVVPEDPVEALTLLADV